MTTHAITPNSPTASSDPKIYRVDPTLYIGRPKNVSNRLPKEIRSYDLLDSLGVTYTHLDHDAIPTIEACQDVDKRLGIDICKNLFLRNARKTDFYLLLLPGNKKFKTAPLQTDRKLPALLCRVAIYGKISG